jgi:endonuclease YncB( thermonuclease family)
MTVFARGRLRVPALLFLSAALFLAGVAAGCRSSLPPHAGIPEGQPERLYRLFLEVEDGDTVLYRGEPLRFMGVDTPEIAHPELGFFHDQPFGQEARSFTRRQIRQARVVTCVADGEDRYGRVLVHLFVDGYPLSVRIVEEGLGYETVSAFGDNGFPEIAEMIQRAARLHPQLPYENPYLWRARNRAR